MRKFLIPLLIVPFLAAGAAKSNQSRLFEKKLPNNKKILHALNRLTFGPRAGDLEAVRKMGLKRWIELQLNPSRIQENPELLDKLKPLDTLQMPTRVMIEHYPTQQMLNAMARGAGAGELISKDPELRARTERLIELYKRRINREGMPPEKPKTLAELLESEQVRTLRGGTREEKVGLLTSLPEDKLAAVATALPPDIRRPLFTMSSTGLQRRLLASTQPQAVPAYDLSEA